MKLEESYSGPKFYLSRTIYWKGENVEITLPDADGNLKAYDEEAWDRIEAVFMNNLNHIASIPPKDINQVRFDKAQAEIIHGSTNQRTSHPGSFINLEDSLKDVTPDRYKTVVYPKGRGPGFALNKPIPFPQNNNPPPADSSSFWQRLKSRFTKK